MDVPTPPARPARRQIFDLDDFTRAELEDILDTANGMKDVLSREIKQTPALRGKTIANLFFSKSTATRISFELAARALSANVITFTEDDNTLQHGSSLIDTARMLQSLTTDLIVLRHSQAGAPYALMRHFHGAVINAGDGCHAHPSQALINLFTIREKVRHMDKIHVVLVGDVLHSGVARSMLWGLTVLGATVTLCAPPTLIGPVDFWLQTWPSLHISYDLADAIEGANVVMLLPAQQYDTAASSIPSLREYRTFFSLSSVSLDRVQHEILVLPSETINTDIEMTPEVANLLQPIIEEQATNGIAVRMALLYLLLAPSS